MQKTNDTARVTFVFLAFYFQCSESRWVKWQVLAAFLSAVPDLGLRAESDRHTMTPMHWSHVIWHAFGWVAIASMIVFFSDLGTHRKARDLRNGRIEFAPSKRSFWALSVVAAYLIYAFVRQLANTHNDPFSLTNGLAFGVVAALLLLQVPKSIVITPDGLEQTSWPGKNRRIGWDEIIEINTGEKRRIITIRGVNGTKIIHGPPLPDRPRMLMELKRHCGENLPSDFPRETGTTD